MPRVCTICQHGERAAIDQALVGGQPLRAIARQWSVSKDALRRHREADLPAALVKASEAHETAHADDLLGRLLRLNAETMAILREARDGAEKDNELALKAIARLEKQTELQAKLLGELDERPTVNVLIAPEWVELRTLVLRALDAHPDAREAVISAIAEGERRAGQ